MTRCDFRTCDEPATHRVRVADHTEGWATAERVYVSCAGHVHDLLVTTHADRLGDAERIPGAHDAGEMARS